MALAKLAVAQRQVAVALDTLLEDQDVTGAVHRLERVIAFLAFRGEHVVAVFVPVAGLFPQALVQNLRPFDLLVAVVPIDAAHVLLHLLPQRPALGVPKHRAGRMFVDVKQIQFTTQLAVVSLLGLLDHGQVLLQVVLAGPGRAVNALQHLVAVIAAPVGARHLHQLEVLELAGAGHVWAAAQVFKIALAVQRHVLVAGNAGNDFCFVVLALPFEIRHGFVAWQHTAHHRLVFARQLRHALFDGHQVFRREGTLVRKIVEEPVFNHRANGHLRIGKQFFHRVSQQVGGGMANHLQAVGIFGGDDGQRAVRRDLKAGVHHLVANFAGQRSFGQAGADRCSNFGYGDRTRKLAL